MTKSKGKHATMVILISSIIYSKLYKGPILAEIEQCKHYSTCHFACYFLGAAVLQCVPILVYLVEKQTPVYSSTSSTSNSDQLLCLLATG